MDIGANVASLPGSSLYKRHELAVLFRDQRIYRQRESVEHEAVNYIPVNVLENSK